VLTKAEFTEAATMRFISTKVHGVLDYLMGIVLLLAPNLLGFADVGGAAVWIPRLIGGMILLQALMTRYELGLLKVLPMSMHLMIDYIASLFLAVSPFLFGFSDQVWVPHVVVGAMIFLESLMTETQPEGMVEPTSTHTTY
jgi:hypothetical protein